MEFFINEEAICSGLNSLKIKDIETERLVNFLEDYFPQNKECIDATNIFKKEVSKIIDERYFALTEEKIKSKKTVLTEAYFNKDYKIILGSGKTVNNTLVINNKKNIKQDLKNFFLN